MPETVDDIFTEIRWLVGCYESRLRKAVKTEKDEERARLHLASLQQLIKEKAHE
jgi:hypothetical protein